MKKILFLFSIVFFAACSTYYKAPNGKIYYPQVNDTLVFTWKITTDTSWYIIKQIQFMENDTLVSISFFPDSTFFDYQYFSLKDDGMYLLSEFYAFNMSLMFWQIKKSLAFGVKNNKLGKINLVKNLQAGDLIQKIQVHSLASYADTITLGDSVVNVLRVDVRTKTWQKSPKIRDHSRMSYYFYPGLGLIYVKGENNYSEKVLFIEKK